MKHVFDFFDNFKGKEISLEELARELSVDITMLNLFFSDYKNYSNTTFRKQFNVEEKYFKDGKEVEDGTIAFYTLRTDPTITCKVEKIINRYYLTPERELDIFLAEFIFGYIPTKGEVDNSDIGGLYTCAWTTNVDIEEEIPFYTTNYSIDDLLGHFPHYQWDIKYQNNNYSVKMNGRDFSYKREGRKLAVIIAETIRDYVRACKFNRYLIQSYYEDYNKQINIESKELYNREEIMEAFNSLEKDSEATYQLVQFNPDGSTTISVNPPFFVTEKQLN